jgi:uncharacterized repeat protein (TIGR02543 family)
MKSSTKWIPFLLIILISIVFITSCDLLIDNPKTYTVTFKDHDGEVLKTQTVEHGDAATAPADPTRTGHSFTGWDKDFTNVTSDLTVTAQYDINTYSVSFESNGGDTVSALTGVGYGATITEPADPTKTGYTFAGWYKEAGLSNEWDFESDTVASDVTLYAKWIAATAYKVEHYRQNIDDDNYTLAETETKYGTTEESVIASPKTYTGFGENENHGDREPTGTIAADGSLVLKLYYDRNTYTVSFESNGGDAVSELTGVRYGATITKPADPTKTGYTFAGWYKETGLSNEWTFASNTVTSNTALYAKWIAVEYRITYNLDGGTNDGSNPTEYTIESETIALKDPSRTGCNFTGWYDAASGGNKIIEITKGSTGDKTLNARWTKVGTIGPAGGYIFYDRATDDSWDGTGWRYLEAAPAGWSGKDNDPEYFFGYHRPEGVNIEVGTNIAIGSGKDNTDTLVAAMGLDAYQYDSGTEKCNYAAKVAKDYSGGGYTDWFLPSRDELNEMYQNLKRQSLGGFSTDSYVSSSEGGNEIMWCQDFSGGNKSNTNRGLSRVRPVRAFK